MALKTLLSQTFTAPVTAQTSPILFDYASKNSVVLQATFAYGSGGTSVDAWVQTTFDGGATWIDVANFHFTTASARFLFNLSALTPITTEYTPTDGTLTANTCKDGVIGDAWRVKYTSTGTYAGNTALTITMHTKP